MSKSSKMKDYGGGHKGGGKDYGGGHKGGDKDYGGGHKGDGGHQGGGKDYGHKGGGTDKPDKVCKTEPAPKPCPPPDSNDCRPVGDNDHHGAVIAADVDADVSANLLQCGSLLNLDADIDAHLGIDLGNDSWHA
jgi:hypothetical protein